MGAFKIIVGDVEDVLPQLEGPFDAVACDPPYGLEFMGKAWDRGVPGEPIWRLVSDLLRPGAFVAAFGGTRTFHRLACGIEDAGFEIRDCLSWLYGSGFPKSLDVSKAIDRQRYDRADVYRVTAWIRAARDRAGLTNREIDQAFNANGMARHWTDVPPNGKQPAVPTIEQIPKLLDLLGAVPPEEIRRLLWDLNGRKGQPGKAWGQREKIGERAGVDTRRQSIACATQAQGLNEGTRHTFDLTAPATDAARTWDGYGTALKPAWEPCVLAMKPLDGTFAANALEHGVAGLNVDGGRIATDDDLNGGAYAESGGRQESPSLRAGGGMNEPGATASGKFEQPSGRWPANVALDEDAAAMLDEQSGELTSGANPTRRGSDKFREAYGDFRGQRECVAHRGADSGGASRFFYTAKVFTAERNAGLAKGDPCRHPTLKPVKLAEWIAKLLLPPPREDGAPRRLLVPFSGAGSEVAGALRAGWDEVVGIERSEEYAAWSRKRIPALERLTFEAAARATADLPGQALLFDA